MSGVAIETCAEGGQDISVVGIGVVGLQQYQSNGREYFCRPGGQRRRRAGISKFTWIARGHFDRNMHGPCDRRKSDLHGCVLQHQSVPAERILFIWFLPAAAEICSACNCLVFSPRRPTLSHQLIVGNTYALKSLVNGKYVTAPNGGTNSLIAQSVSIGTAEQFKIVDAGGGNIGFLALVNTQYVTAENNGASPLIANRTGVGSWETFTEFDAGGGNIGLRAMNDGKYVTAADSGASPLIAQSTTIGAAESFSVQFVSGVPPSSADDLMATPGIRRRI